MSFNLKKVDSCDYVVRNVFNGKLHIKNPTSLFLRKYMRIYDKKATVKSLIIDDRIYIKNLVMDNLRVLECNIDCFEKLRLPKLDTLKLHFINGHDTHVLTLEDCHVECININIVAFGNFMNTNIDVPNGYKLQTVKSSYYGHFPNERLPQTILDYDYEDVIITYDIFHDTQEFEYILKKLSTKFLNNNTLVIPDKYSKIYDNIDFDSMEYDKIVFSEKLSSININSLNENCTLLEFNSFPKIDYDLNNGNKLNIKNIKFKVGINEINLKFPDDLSIKKISSNDSKILIKLISKYEELIMTIDKLSGKLDKKCTLINLPDKYLDGNLLKLSNKYDEINFEYYFETDKNYTIDFSSFNDKDISSKIINLKDYCSTFDINSAKFDNSKINVLDENNNKIKIDTFINLSKISKIDNYYLIAGNNDDYFITYIITSDLNVIKYYGQINCESKKQTLMYIDKIINNNYLECQFLSKIEEIFNNNNIDGNTKYKITYEIIKVMKEYGYENDNYAFNANVVNLIKNKIIK